MTDIRSGSPVLPQTWGPGVLGVRGSSPLPGEGEGVWQPLSIDVDGRLQVAPQARDPLVTTYSAPAAANTAVAITLAAQAPDISWQISGFTSSYSAAPTAGTVVVNDGAS